MLGWPPDSGQQDAMGQPVPLRRTTTAWRISAHGRIPVVGGGEANSYSASPAPPFAESSARCRPGRDGRNLTAAARPSLGWERERRLERDELAPQSTTHMLLVSPFPLIDGAARDRSILHRISASIPRENAHPRVNLRACQPAGDRGRRPNAGDSDSPPHRYLSPRSVTTTHPGSK